MKKLSKFQSVMRVACAVMAVFNILAAVYSAHRGMWGSAGLNTAFAIYMVILFRKP